MTALQLALPLEAADAPAAVVVSADDLHTLALKLCALSVGDALVADECRVEYFVTPDGEEAFALIRGGFVCCGVWHGGLPQVVEIANTKARRAWALRKFALALAWRGATDCEPWSQGSGLDRQAGAVTGCAEAGEQRRLWG